MGTVLKYLFYAIIIFAVYLIAVGFYHGTINKDSTIGELTDHVTSNTKEMMQEGYERTKEAVQGGMDNVETQTEEVVEEIE